MKFFTHTSLSYINIHLLKEPNIRSFLSSLQSHSLWSFWWTICCSRPLWHLILIIFRIIILFTTTINYYFFHRFLHFYLCWRLYPHDIWSIFPIYFTSSIFFYLIYYILLHLLWVKYLQWICFYDKNFINKFSAIIWINIMNQYFIILMGGKIYSK